MTQDWPRAEWTTVEVGCWERGFITLFPLLVRPGGARLGFPLGKLGLTRLGTPVNGQAGWGHEVLAIPAQWGLPGGQCLLWSSHRVGGDVSRKAVWGSPLPTPASRSPFSHRGQTCITRERFPCPIRLLLPV